MHAAIEIPNLLYRYANFMDSGDFAGAAQMFKHGCIEAEGREISGQDDIVNLWKDWVFLYEGQPLTRHLITNPILTLSETNETATCQSQWTVLQATDTLPLQPIATGRYDDNFAVIDGNWQFKKRKYDGVDLIGNMSQHTRNTLGETDG